MIRLLGRKTSGNVQKVVWLLDELGLDYRREDYGRQFGNTADAAYLDLNPTGKVPTLVDGETVVWESNTILRYLAAKAGSAFYPAGLAERAAIERWMDWQLAALNGPYMAIFRAAKKPEGERGPDLARDGPALATQLDIVEAPWPAARGWRARPSPSPISVSAPSRTAVSAFRSSCRRWTTSVPGTTAWRRGPPSRRPSAAEAGVVRGGDRY